MASFIENTFFTGHFCFLSKCWNWHRFLSPDHSWQEIALWSVGKTYEVSNGQVVAEHKLSIPLVNGLEMKMSVNASAIERMKVTGKLDILSLMIDPKSMEIDGTIEPRWDGALLPPPFLFSNCFSSHSLSLFPPIKGSRRKIRMRTTLTIRDNFILAKLQLVSNKLVWM